VQSFKKSRPPLSEALKSRKLATSAVVVLALLGMTACGDRTTGVTQLPVPPSRDVVAFTNAPPANGPPDAPTNDCKKGGQGAYRLGAGDRIRVIVPADPDISSDYEVNSSGAITARRRDGQLCHTSRPAAACGQPTQREKDKNRRRENAALRSLTMRRRAFLETLHYITVLR